MTMFESYHAHLYYPVDDMEPVLQLIERIKESFSLPVGRAWEKPVGPHPIGSCQISVPQDKFSEFIPWLMKERGDIDVFVHARSGDDLLDHTQYVMWLGKSYPLNLDIFQN